MKKEIVIFVLFNFFILGLFAQNKEIVFTSRPVDLGPNVNSGFTEGEPKISPDGKTLFVCRRSDPNNVGGTANDADIWYSELQDDEKWGLAKNFGEPVNNDSFNQLIGLRSDGNAMLVLGQYPNPDNVLANVHISHKTSTGWSNPEPMEIENFFYPSRDISFTVSVNFEILIIAVKRQDAIGLQDLYVCKLKKKNLWSEPINMGSVVNTEQSEIYPVIANDNKTLYFSSKGHGGYGHYDIFVSRRLDETWTKWSKPQNMGNVINTSGFDADFTVDTQGKNAYISSNIKSGKTFDIFSILLPKEAKPNPVTMIIGKVLNKQTNKPIEAEVTYQDLSSGEELGRLSSDPVDGVFKIVLPYGKKYSFSANAKNFAPISENVDLTIYSEYKEIGKNLYLVPIEVNQIVRLNNLFFASGKSILNTDSDLELNNLIKLLNENPTMKIEVGGHTDDIGSEATNKALSKARAKIVADYLISKNIDKTRITVVGYGEKKPISTTKNDVARKKNRRVEFTILSK